MTKQEFENLKEGRKVWFYPNYLRFAFPAIVKTIDGVKGLWVNFFGDGQCHFTPRFDTFYAAVSKTKPETRAEK